MALIDSVFSHDESFLINNVQKEYDEMKEEIISLKGLSKALDHIVGSVEKIQKVKIQKMQEQEKEE